MNLDMPQEANKFTKEQIAMFKKILVGAGQVTKDTFDGLIAKNPQIVILGEFSSPKGIGALKIPYIKHKVKVFRQAKSLKSVNNYRFELGWIVSLEKGSGNKIMGALKCSYSDVYSTVREDNEPMIFLLKKYGYKQEGSPYKSDRGEYNLLLFIKNK